MAVATPFVPFPFKSPERVVEPVPPEETPSDADKVRVPILPTVANKLVELAVVAKKLVEVAFVLVALIEVKFCKVEEPVIRKLERVVRPLKVFVPLKIFDPVKVLSV
jgi:hypothetical protein